MNMRFNTPDSSERCATNSLIIEKYILLVSTLVIIETFNISINKRTKVMGTPGNVKLKK